MSPPRTPAPPTPTPPLPGAGAPTRPSLTAAAAANLDKPTLSLIRRVLCPHAPPTTALEELLPRLTSSADVDLQIWALLASVVRDFVGSWYAAVTDDTELVREIVRVVGVVVGALAGRVEKIDLEVLILDEIPAILENHIHDYRLAQSRLGSFLAPNLTHAQIFHNLQPHPALSSPTSERLYLKLLSSGLLSLLLPPGDLSSACEYTLLREIIANTILHSTIDTLSDPSTLYTLLHSLLTPPPALPPAPKPQPQYPAIAIPPALDTLLTTAARACGIAWTLVSSLLHTLHTPPPPPRRPRHILRMRIFALLSTALQLPARRPWLLGNILLLARPFTTRRNRVGAVVDGLLADLIAARVGAGVVVEGVKMVRGIVAGGGGGDAAGKEEEERGKVGRREVEEAVRGWVVETEWLEVLSVKGLNKYLVYGLLDLLVGRLAPELVEVGPGEVRKGRVGGGV